MPFRLAYPGPSARVEATARRREGTWAFPSDRLSLPLAIGLIAGFSLLAGVVGADARWLAALGHDIGAHGQVPQGLPFAATPTRAWHNVTVLAELTFWGLEALLGDRGIALAQTLAVAIAFAALGYDAVRAGAGRQQTASTCLIAALGGVSSLAVARVQLFSVALFPVLLVLLRSDSRQPSQRKIWMVVPLLALWSNLHGAVLVGVAVTLIYLAVGRRRAHPLETIVVAGLCLGALCANPAGLHALTYYRNVLFCSAARQGEGMWGPLSPMSPFDDLLVAAVVMMLWRARRARLAFWEAVVVVLLAAMTVHSARSGIWLLFVLVAPASAGAGSGSRWRLRGILMAAATVAAIVTGAVRGPTPTGPDRAVVAWTMHLAAGSPILAGDIAAERIALAGGRVWASDPIDAFEAPVQAAYLRWIDGERAGLAAVGRNVRVVLVARGTPAAALMQAAPGFRLVGRLDGFELFRRVAAPPGSPFTPGPRSTKD
jgi:hypothetical protein